ncbi:MAG TPA: class I SAM-dependent methyltransferase [Candidatus Nanoarchaeia archaeon]|nr:class I SAM-dependent methyltransferase [Candidatus Nanoarchaeia archaeon]
MCEEKLGQSLELGMQPVCNHFLNKKDDKEKLYRLSIVQCQECGLVQLGHRFPSQALKPVHEWITYAEPEEHLDNLTEHIMKTINIKESGSKAKIKAKIKAQMRAKIIGMSFKDDTLLMRLEKNGFAVERLKLKEDLGIEDEHVGVETIQAQLKPDNIKKIIKKKGAADIVIARHILEHAYNLKEFITSLKMLIKPKGYLILEVPDCGCAFERLDYPIIWEEHTLYFTPETFKNTLARNGLDISYFNAFEYALENSLVIIAQLAGPKANSKKANSKSSINKEIINKEAIKKEKERFNVFCKSFDKRKTEITKFLKENKTDNSEIALLGAGHFACGFINFLGLKDYVDMVIDDNIHKKGLLMPGSALPIIGSEALLGKKIKLCLLSLNPRTEEKVVQENQEFINQGGIFRSIFASSRYAIKL